MDITNNSKSRLNLPDGQSLKSGETVSSPDFDQDNRVMKAWIDAGLISVAKGAEKEVKAVSQMTVKELETYIKANGGDFAESDNKPELLMIAQDIEEQLAANQE